MDEQSTCLKDPKAKSAPPMSSATPSTPDTRDPRCPLTARALASAELVMHRGTSEQAHYIRLDKDGNIDGSGLDTETIKPDESNTKDIRPLERAYLRFLRETG